MKIKLLITGILFIGIVSCKKSQYSCNCSVTADGDSYTTQDIYDNSSDASNGCNTKQSELEAEHANASNKSISCETKEEESLNG